MTRARVLACLLLLAGCESAAEASARLSLEGRALLDAGDFAGATERFTRATEADPTRFDAWTGLAASQAALSHWPEARAAADRCIAITDDPVCRVVHADAALHSEEWETAIDDQTRALALDPARLPLYLARARASAHLPDIERTAGLYREAIGHDVEPATSRLELALLLLDRCGMPEGMDQARATATSADRTEVRELLSAARPLAEGDVLVQIEAATVRSAELDAAALATVPTNPLPPVGTLDSLDGLLGGEIGEVFGTGGLGLSHIGVDGPGRSALEGIGPIGGHHDGPPSGSGAGRLGDRPPPNPDEN